VQALRNMLELVRTRLSGLSPSAKLLAGSLVVIVALGFFLIAQWSATTDLVPFAVKEASLEEARSFLSARGVSYEEKEGQILVPVDRRNELVSAFAEQASSGTGIDFDRLIALDSPFETTRQSETKKLIALQNVLANTIQGFRNVKSARVSSSFRPSLRRRLVRRAMCKRQVSTSL
jgi:flagellar biosynthesis/type III secretory pathway M-ring protein FliF/YscJ